MSSFFEKYEALINLGICAILGLIAGYIYKWYTHRNTTSQVFSSTVLDKEHIKRHIEILRKYNPGTEESLLRSLYFSLRSIIMGYKKYESSLNLGQLKANTLINEKTPSEISEIVFKSDKSRTDLFKLDFIDENGRRVLQLSDRDRNLIQNNEYVFEDLVARSEIFIEHNLSTEIIKKSIRTNDSKMKYVSPIEVMFCKYVNYFILKSE